MNDVPMNPDNAPLTPCLIHGSVWCTCRREVSLPSDEVRKTEASPTGPVLSAPRMEDVIHDLRATLAAEKEQHNRTNLELRSWLQKCESLKEELAQRDARIAELERQNKELVRIAGNFGEGSEEDTDSFLARIEQGMENLRGLERDRERLDWVIKNGLQGAVIWKGVEGRWLIVGQQKLYETLRAAIDAAMKEPS